MTSCPSGAQKSLTGAEGKAANFGLNQAEGTLPQATGAISDSLGFFKALASGDRETIMQTLQPSIASLTSQYDTARASAEEFAPRGGGRAAALEELPFQKAGAISTMVEGAQAEGAQGEASIGQLLGEIGIGELGTGSTTAANAVGQLQTQQQISNEQGASTGASIGSLIALLAL